MKPSPSFTTLAKIVAQPSLQHQLSFLTHLLSLLPLSYTITAEIYSGLNLSSNITELLEVTRRNEEVIDLIWQIIKWGGHTKNKKADKKVEEY